MEYINGVYKLNIPNGVYQMEFTNAKILLDNVSN